MIETIGIISTIIAVIGVIANNYMLWVCFPLWFVSNLMGAWIHYQSGVYSLLERDVIFLGLAVHGFYKWKIKGASK